MIWHDYEPHTFSLHLFELMVQNSQDNPLGMIEIEQSPTTINRERQKVDVSLVDEFAALVAHA
ncbi:MAG: hypothetical protein V4719_27280 [Planctomycetota bacterium]